MHSMPVKYWEKINSSSQFKWIESQYKFLRVDRTDGSSYELLLPLHSNSGPPVIKVREVAGGKPLWLCFHLLPCRGWLQLVTMGNPLHNYAFGLIWFLEIEAFIELINSVEDTKECFYQSRLYSIFIFWNNTEKSRTMNCLRCTRTTKCGCTTITTADTIVAAADLYSEDMLPSVFEHG